MTPQELLDAVNALRVDAGALPYAQLSERWDRVWTALDHLYGADAVSITLETITWIALDIFDSEEDAMPQYDNRILKVVLTPTAIQQELLDLNL